MKTIAMLTVLLTMFTAACADQPPVGVVASSVLTPGQCLEDPERCGKEMFEDPARVDITSGDFDELTEDWGVERPPWGDLWTRTCTTCTQVQGGAGCAYCCLRVQSNGYADTVSCAELGSPNVSAVCQSVMGGGGNSGIVWTCLTTADVWQ